MDTWRTLLPGPALEQAAALAGRAAREREEGRVIFPPQGQIFRALELTPPEEVRAVILGQDPYHTPGAANGLAFSVSPGTRIPPSLRTIFTELQADLGCPPPASGDLSPWARRGILLLNTILTVEQGKPASHSAWGWQDFVGAVLRCCAQLPQPAAFLLWGARARSFVRDIPLSGPDRFCLATSHPSPLGARRGSAEVPAFLGSRPFSKVNAFLRSRGVPPLDWSLPS